MFSEPMSISSFFSKLGAPLKNVRWSWGAVRDSDGAVFLRVWREDQKSVDDKMNSFVQITDNAKYANDRYAHGWRERLRHIECVRDDKKCYLVMCRAKDSNASPREIAEWDKKNVFIGGELREMNGDTWIEVVRAVPISEMIKREESC